MPSLVGADALAAVRLGSSVVSRIYLGLQEVYGAAGAALPAIASVRQPDPIMFEAANPNTIFKRNVASAPVSANQATYLAEFKKQVALYGNIGSNFHEFTTAFYAVNGSQVPPVTINFWDEQNKGYVPTELYTDGGPEIFENVPLPANAIPALGTDASLSLYDQETDTLWGFWQLRRMTPGFNNWGKTQRVPQADGEWAAVWGFKQTNASTSRGSAEGFQSVSATGIFYEGMTIGTTEVASGSIKHAMAIQLVRCHPTIASYPAPFPYPGAPERRHDTGWLTFDNAAQSTFIPQGMRIRLKPSVDVDAIPGMTPTGRKIAKAAQVYGFIIADTAGSVNIVGESGYPTQVITGTNPWAAILAADGLAADGSQNFNVMQNFPVDDLEFIALNWGSDVADVPTVTSYTDPITEAQGAAWSGTHWATEVQRGSGTFLVDSDAREMTTDSGSYSTGMLAVNQGPSWGSFKYVGSVRVDSNGEKYAKLGFWSDGVALGAPTSGHTISSWWLGFDNSTGIQVSSREGDVTTNVGAVATGFPINNAVSYKVEIEANATTGNVKVWLYTGATRPVTPTLDVTHGAGRRSGVFTVGLENGAAGTPQSMAYGPMTVTAL